MNLGRGINLRTRQSRRMNLRAGAAAGALLLALGCLSPGPVVDPGARPPGVGGTIAGSVSATGASSPLSGRIVRAVDEVTGARFETSTGTGGSYTLKVPAGKYRLEVELRQGETFQTRPDVTDVGVGDIDSGRDFVVTAGR
jgi:hypothetical protein